MCIRDRGVDALLGYQSRAHNDIDIFVEKNDYQNFIEIMKANGLSLIHILIFMDIQMPVMDGCAATVCIRALPRKDAATVPIIAMTASAFADDRQKTKDAGMNGHLAKPVEVHQLQQVLQKWLGRAE